MTYAVVETGGKQYKVEKGSTLLVDRLRAEVGDKVGLRAVAFRDGEMVLGPDLEKVKVEAKVTAHERGPKIRVFKYKRRKGYRRLAAGVSVAPSRPLERQLRSRSALQWPPHARRS